MDEILVNFGLINHSGVFGSGFRAKKGVLQPFFLQERGKGHQGHQEDGVVLGCTLLFKVKQKPFLAYFCLLKSNSQLFFPI